MTSEYKCLTCKWLQPDQFDLLSCDLQDTKYTDSTKTTWFYVPTCKHDASVKEGLAHTSDKVWYLKRYGNLPDKYCEKSTKETYE